MSTKTKKIKRITIFICLLLAFILAACSNGGGDTTPPASGGDTNTNTEPAKGDDAPPKSGVYTIGHAQMAPTWLMDQYVVNMDRAMKDANPASKIDSLPCDAQPDKMQDAIQGFIDAGADAINWYPAFGNLTPQIMQMCEQANVPVGIAHIPILPEQYLTVQSSPLFTGFIGGDTYQDGYNLGEIAVDMGYTKAIILAGDHESFDMISKSNGFADAFDSKGGTVLDIAWQANPAEGPAKISDLFSSNPEADVLYSCTGVYTVQAIGTMENLNMTDVAIFTSDVDLDQIELMKQGIVTAGTGGSQVEMLLTLALTINWLDGHPILDEYGNAPLIPDMSTLSLTSENISDFDNIFLKQQPMTAKMFQYWLYAYNPNITYQDYYDFTRNFTTIEWYKGWMAQF